MRVRVILRGVFAALCIALQLAYSKVYAANFDPADGWEEFAHFDGALRIPAATYVNGLGSFTDANYSKQASNYGYAQGDFTIAVVMGTFTDYFKPASASLTLEAVLTSHQNHVWSADPSGVFVQPAYFPSVEGHLGGSAAAWPQDGRSYLSFWGVNSRSGGCCALAAGDSATWGRAFTIYVQAPPVPEPTTGLLLCTGFLFVLALASRGRRL